MNDNGRELVKRMHHEAFERARKNPPPPPKPMTIHYGELPAGQPDSPLFHEWNFYRREVGRLLEEGHEGRFVLIKGEEIIGIWDTHEDVRAVALQKYLMQPCLIHQIRSEEPVVRQSLRFWQCQS